MVVFVKCGRNCDIRSSDLLLRHFMLLLFMAQGYVDMFEFGDIGLPRRGLRETDRRVIAH